MLEKILLNYLKSVAPRVNMKDNENLAKKYLNKLSAQEEVRCEVKRIKLQGNN